MAAVKEREEVDVKELLALATKFIQKWENRTRPFDDFVADVRAIKSTVIHLVNAEESLGRRVKEAEINLAKTEREAQTRLSSIDMGHRALTDRLSKKEIELANKVSEQEKMALNNAKERHELELLKEEYAQKISGLSRIGKK